MYSRSHLFDFPYEIGRAWIGIPKIHTLPWDNPIQLILLCGTFINLFLQGITIRIESLQIPFYLIVQPAYADMMGSSSVIEGK